MSHRRPCPALTWSVPDSPWTRHRPSYPLRHITHLHTDTAMLVVSLALMVMFRLPSGPTACACGCSSSGSSSSTDSVLPQVHAIRV